MGGVFLFGSDMFSGADGRAVALVVALGLVVGKTAGIAWFTWLGVKFGLGALPDGVTWSHVLGASAIGGIGFTVSLFVADLAFSTGSGLEGPARTGVLGGSVLAASVSAAILLVASRPAEQR